MTALRVYLFDRLCIQYGDQDVTGAFPPRLQEILAYLLLYGSRTHLREELAALFWGASSTVQSKKYLRQALWQIHAICDSRALSPDGRLFLVDNNRISLNPQADVWVDVAEFERACASAHGVGGQLLDEAQVRALHLAARLYRGDLLPGLFYDWCLYERERLQNHYLTILDKLMDHARAAGDYGAGLHYAESSLCYDSAREPTYRRAMRLYALAGDRAASLRLYDRCREALARELAVEPSASTVALYQRIRGECLATVPPLTATCLPAGPRQPRNGDGDLLERLKSLQQIVAGIQEELQHMIEAADAPSEPDPVRSAFSTR